MEGMTLLYSRVHPLDRYPVHWMPEAGGQQCVHCSEPHKSFREAYACAAAVAKGLCQEFLETQASAFSAGTCVWSTCKKRAKPPTNSFEQMIHTMEHVMDLNIITARQKDGLYSCKMKPCNGTIGV